MTELTATCAKDRDIFAAALGAGGPAADPSSDERAAKAPSPRKDAPDLIALALTKVHAPLAAHERVANSA